MQVEFKNKTDNGNYYYVLEKKTIDRDYIEGKCIRHELIVENITISINGIDITFEDLREANQQMILEEIEEA
jgi:hypothetical protein